MGDAATQIRLKSKPRQRKVLVTGGGGFLGGSIIKLLAEKGEAIRSFSRNYYQELDVIGVEQIQGDLSDKQAVGNACAGIDTIFHVAAKPGVWGRYEDFYRTNVIGTKNIISACRMHKISKLIYTSSPSVIFNATDMENINETVPYPDRFHAYYPQTKALAEQKVIVAARRGLLTIILRPHLIWGPKDNHLVPRIIARSKKLFKVGSGNNLVDTTYIDNAAYAHILADEKLDQNPELSGNIYFISQGEPIALWEMINRILAAAGLEPVKRSIPKKAAWLIGAIFECVYKTLQINSEPPMTRFVANELSTAHWFDISAACKDLGYLPRISIETGLKRLEAELKHR
ncbi:MAG: NAD-dependent epimerase/dehydratase family protein [Desulfobacterales bacterium]|nr:NAD-dependent epimerase/dehydratase family protein [Desulfobacterales bacterium]